MAVKGAIAKEEIKKRILKEFDGSFIYNSGKEIRIPWDENGTPVQIKIQMVAAKENVYPEGNEAQGDAAALSETVSFPSPTVKTNSPVEPTEEEKKNLEDLLAALDLN